MSASLRYSTKITHKSGKIEMSTYETDRLKAILKLIPEDKVLKLEISVYNEKKEKEKNRTEQQNKYYHKLLDIICEHTGHEHLELHEELKIMFLSYPWVKNDKEYTIVKSTRDLTSKEFANYLEKVFNWASSELNLVLPDSSSYF